MKSALKLGYFCLFSSSIFMIGSGFMSYYFSKRLSYVYDVGNKFHKYDLSDRAKINGKLLSEYSGSYVEAVNSVIDVFLFLSKVQLISGLSSFIILFLIVRSKLRSKK
jgi:hypothetical protein